jgi:endonuclease YncB( thermonuclease family)
LLSRHAVLGAVIAMFVSSTMAMACEGLRDGPKGTVTEVVDGDTVILDNGIVVRLIGTQAPKLALGRDDFEDWPLADEARNALEALVLGEKIVVRFGGEDTDRYGRSLGQLFTTGGTEVWAQQQMLGAGMARVYSFPDNRKCLAELMAAEGRARTMKLGIWADPYYSVRRADRPAALLPLQGHYELVEGRVLNAESAQGRVFLNFGRLWKEDFTAVIDRAALSLFADAGVDPTRLGGALIRVRGWVDSYDGPRIEVTHPEQIEVLAGP